MLPVLPTSRTLLVVSGQLSHQEITARLRDGAAVALFRGVVVDASAAAAQSARFRAAVASQGPEAVLCPPSSAVQLGIPWLPPTWSAPDATVHVAVPREVTRRHRRGLRIHHAALAPEDVVTVNGIRTVGVGRTLADLARDPRQPRLQVVQLIDGALRRGLVTPDLLQDALTRLIGMRLVSRSRELFDLSRCGVDSPKETELRLALWDGGVTGLVTDIHLRDYDGTVLARGDLADPRRLLWGEYDGFDTHTERSVFGSDRAGDRWLERRGWHVMRFSQADLARPQRLAREWLTAWANAPARIAAMASSRSPEVDAARRALGLPD
ncbi:MAG TPA: hypothetical protein VHW92_02665 [Mycobacteriales bacterium]|jgi:hypothetical protein|nr:hypothetical protein [Mycobacteriales bacterium]